MDARCIVQGLKGLAGASVSQFLSYLGKQIEVAPPVRFPLSEQRMKRPLPSERRRVRWD
jgi:hypothetical protein